MPNDFDRLYTVNIFKNINYSRSKEFRDIVTLAAEICETPVALITLLDDETNAFIAKVGTDLESMPADGAFCEYTITQDEVMVVNDTFLDGRFSNNPVVIHAPGVRFYAGAPLSVNKGHKVGTLCVLDIEPKELTRVQLRTLELLSRQVTILMEFELSQKLLQEQLHQIESRNKVMMNISQVHSHEFRGPVASLQGLMNIIREEEYIAPKEYLQMMEEVIDVLDEKIHLIVEYTQVL